MGKEYGRRCKHVSTVHCRYRSNIHSVEPLPPVLPAFGITGILLLRRTGMEWSWLIIMNYEARRMETVFRTNSIIILVVFILFDFITKGTHKTRVIKTANNPTNDTPFDSLFCFTSQYISMFRKQSDFRQRGHRATATLSVAKHIDSIN